MLCEINPLIVTPDGEVKALDSKFTVDDNALFRHPDIAEMRDPEAYPPEERAAREKGVTYVKLDGAVGILGNGAGLVMSTLDVVALAGGRAANFCDLGGGGDAQGVVDALEIITGDPQVKSILFNIFGGITRCDEVARGILAGARADDDRAPDRRAARRDERGGGAAAARGGGAAEPPRRADDARRGAARGGAGRMTDVWSERAQAYRESAAHREGPDLDLIVEWAAGAEDGARRRHRRRARRAAAARGRAERGHDRRRAGDAARRRLPRRGAAVRRRELRRRRLAGSRRTTSTTCARRCARWRGSPRRAVIVVDNTFGGDALEEAEQLRDPSHVRCYTAEEWRALFEDAGLGVDDVRFAAAARRARAVARRAPAARARTPRASASSSPTGSRTAGSTLDRIALKAVKLVAIVVDRDTKLVVQGLTGREGSFHGLRNRAYGTQLVAGVTPGKGGQDVEGVPVFDTVAEAVAETGANTTMIFVPARFAADAIYEAVDAGIGTVICIAEGLAAHDMLRVYNYIRPRGVTMLGPNCPGRSRRARRTSGSSRRRSSARARSGSSPGRGR